MKNPPPQTVIRLFTLFYSFLLPITPHKNEELRFGEPSIVLSEAVTPFYFTMFTPVNDLRSWVYKKGG
jgi:hypothetical protein